MTFKSAEDPPKSFYDELREYSQSDLSKVPQRVITQDSLNVTKHFENLDPEDPDDTVYYTVENGKLIGIRSGVAKEMRQEEFPLIRGDYPFVDVGADGKRGELQHHVGRPDFKALLDAANPPTPKKKRKR